MRTRIVAAAIVLAAGPLPAQGIARTPPTISIVGNDYAFIQRPETLPPGETLFAFENRGRVRHELSISLLKQGKTVREVLDSFTQGTRRRDLMESTIGILLAFPADTSGGRLLVTLIPGRTYVLVCSLRDTPDAQPHVMLGMISGFSVPERR